MLARLGSNSTLQLIGREVLLASEKSKSWFLTVRSLCQQYGLPDPLNILQSPPTKEYWKRMCKASVMTWWEVKLRGEASLLSSLTYFQPTYMSLNTTHPIWSMAESPYEVSKATTVANMLSGRYVTDHRARHWSNQNPEGICQLCQVFGLSSTPGTLEHQLLSCPALAEVRSQQVSLWSAYMVGQPSLLPIISAHTLSPGPEGVKLHM